MIFRYTDFIKEELSKNDPIPEISRSGKLGIILIGSPGSGKSTFFNNFIFTRNRNIKSFSTDDVSLLLTKDPKIYHSKAYDLNLGRLKRFIETGQSFVYDTTGAHNKQVYDITELAHKHSYKIIFVHIVTNLDTAKRQNMLRTRNVDYDYIEFAYSRQFPNMVDYSEKIKPDNYYIVLNIGGKYKFYKYKNGQIMKRKNDVYVPIRNYK